MRSVVDRNVVMRRLTVNGSGKRAFLSMGALRGELGEGGGGFSAADTVRYVKDGFSNVESLYVRVHLPGLHKEICR